MRLTPLVASHFRSDGGTMFGLVPKPIWHRRLPADDRNQVAQHAHSLLIELDDGRRGLLDTGCGPAENFGERDRQMHGLGPGWPLGEALAARGLAPADIDFVAFTHLHWDHAGSLVAPPSAAGREVFPRATYHVHAQEWADALGGDPLLYKSYPPDIVATLRGLPAERLRQVTDDAPDIAPGLRLLRSGGHTRGHAVLVAEGPGLAIGHPGAAALGPIDCALFAGDVCPTRHHLRMVFQTSYDTYPLDTRAWKRAWFPRLARPGALLLFDHDPDLYGAVIRPDEREEYAVAMELRCDG